MLTCYLDDSGKDPQNRVETVAGYIAYDNDWKLFESEVEQWFAQFNVNILHAKDLNGTKGEFAGWSILQKQAFVSRVCQARSAYLTMGMSASVLKVEYHKMADARGNLRTKTPYSFCFNTIVDWVLTDIHTGKAANTDGVAFYWKTATKIMLKRRSFSMKSEIVMDLITSLDPWTLYQKKAAGRSS